MKYLPPPSIGHISVIDECIKSIGILDLRTRIENIKEELLLAGSDYCIKATEHELFNIPQFYGNDNDVVLKNVTKKELKNLYTEQMVPMAKPSRRFYDELKLSTELGICPFCGLGHVSTLDHYLPKSKFPLISILPHNLVPCCSDCNKGKTANIAARPEDQCLHPYFDEGKFIFEQWIFASVIHTSPVTIQYFVDPPAEWDDFSIVRAKNHFRDYSLRSRFAVQAANELASLIYELQIDYETSGIAGVKALLEKKASSSSRYEINSWKTAMYMALSTDEWFYSEGFLSR